MTVWKRSQTKDVQEKLGSHDQGKSRGILYLVREIREFNKVRDQTEKFVLSCIFYLSIAAGTTIKWQNG